MAALSRIADVTMQEGREAEGRQRLQEVERLKEQERQQERELEARHRDRGMDHGW